MKVIWSQAPCSAGQIIAALKKTDASWHPRTAKAFLNRLVKKKVLGFKKEGGACVYRPPWTAICWHAAWQEMMKESC